MATNLAGETEPVAGGHFVESGAQAVHVIGAVTVITQQQPVLIALPTTHLALLKDTQQYMS